MSHKSIDVGLAKNRNKEKQRINYSSKLYLLRVMQQIRSCWMILLAIEMVISANTYRHTLLRLKGNVTELQSMEIIVIDVVEGALKQKLRCIVILIFIYCLLYILLQFMLYILLNITYIMYDIANIF